MFHNLRLSRLYPEGHPPRSTYSSPLRLVSVRPLVVTVTLRPQGHPVSLRSRRPYSLTNVSLPDTHRRYGSIVIRVGSKSGTKDLW